VIIILLAVVQYTGLMVRVLPALKVGDTGYSVSNANFFYRNTYASFYNEYADSIGSYLDPSQPLSRQPSLFDLTMTWAQYFWREALSQIKQVTALTNAAKADGFTLSAEDREAIDGWLAGLKSAAKDSGYTYNRYIALYYGDGNTEKTIRAMMERSLLADRYQEDKINSLVFSEDELARYYADNHMSYDSIAYIYGWVDGAGEDDSEESQEAAMAQALEIARAITDAPAGRDDFRQRVLGLTGEASVTTMTALQDISAAYAAWLMDETRREGDMDYIKQSDGYYVLYFINSTDNHYNTVSVRHILIMTQDTDGDGVYSQEEIDAAYEAIMDIYNAWREAGGTEEAFSEMAMIYSEDYGSSGNGGLYEQIVKNQMVEAFDEFCFRGHEHGDTEIVYGSSENYEGYHLIFFVGEGEPYWRLLVESAKRSEEFSAWIQRLVSPYTVTETFLMRYAADR